jgi:hypothetical protein
MIYLTYLCMAGYAWGGVIGQLKSIRFFVETCIRQEATLVGSQATVWPRRVSDSTGSVFAKPPKAVEYAIFDLNKAVATAVITKGMTSFSSGVASMARARVAPVDSGILIRSVFAKNNRQSQPALRQAAAIISPNVIASISLSKTTTSILNLAYFSRATVSSSCASRSRSRRWNFCRNFFSILTRARLASAASFSAFAARSRIVSISVFDSSRTSVSMLRSSQATQNSATIPTTTTNPPNSCRWSLCPCSAMKTSWENIPKKLAASGTNSIARPPTTSVLKAWFHRQRPSDQRSSSFLIASFGIPLRKRRSLGRIEIVITLGVWLGCALAVWIILRWF